MPLPHQMFQVTITQPEYPHPHDVPCPFKECKGVVHIDARTEDQKADWPYPVFEDLPPEEQAAIYEIARGEN